VDVLEAGYQIKCARPIRSNLLLKDCLLPDNTCIQGESDIFAGANGSSERRFLHGWSVEANVLYTGESRFKISRRSGQGWKYVNYPS